MRWVTIRPSARPVRRNQGGFGAFLHHAPHFIVNVAAFDSGEMLDAVGAVDFLDGVILDRPARPQVGHDVHFWEGDGVDTGKALFLVGAATHVELGGFRADSI